MKRTLQAMSAIAFATAAVTGVAQDLPKTHVKVVGTVSSLSQYKNLEKPFWEKVVTEKSGGAVTADIQAFNEMGLKGHEIGRLMKQGVIDFGSTIIGYMAGDDPKNEAMDLAGLSPNMGTARKVADAYRPVMEKLFKDKYNVKLLGIWPLGAQVFYCKSPINSLADLKGKKVRTGNRTLAEFVQAFGATGVTLAFGEVPQALQTGVVDCAITGTLSGYSAKWYEVSNYLYVLPVGWSHVTHGVSYSTWNKLDPAVRYFLQAEIRGLEDRIWRSSAEEISQGIACNTGEGKCYIGEPAKMKLVNVSDEDRVALGKVLDEVVLKKWSDRCGQACADEFNSTIGAVVAAKAR